MRKDVREFIRRLESVGLTVESTPGHYHFLRDGKPLRKQRGLCFPCARQPMAHPLSVSRIVSVTGD
jgi:hypothetical protein